MSDLPIYTKDSYRGFIGHSCFRIGRYSGPDWVEMESVHELDEEQKEELDYSLQNENDEKNKIFFDSKMASIPLAKAVVTAAIGLPAYHFIDKEDWKHSAVSAGIVGASVLASSSVIQFIPVSMLAFLKSYAEAVVASLLAAVSKMLLAKYSSVVVSKGFVREMLVALGCAVAGDWLEAPVRPYLPSFIQ